MPISLCLLSQPFAHLNLEEQVNRSRVTVSRQLLLNQPRGRVFKIRLNSNRDRQRVDNNNGMTYEIQPLQQCPGEETMQLLSFKDLAYVDGQTM